MGSRARRWSGRGALAATGALAAALFGECAARLAGAAPTRFPRPQHYESPDKRAGLDAYPSNPRGYFALDLREPSVRARYAALAVPVPDAAGAALAPFAVAGSYNADRCRDRERAPRAPGTLRVLVLGDSFTEGQGVRQGDTFARRLAPLLTAALGAPVEVLNCGRRGRDFPALFTAFEQLVPAYEPDVVLYAMVLNDPVRSDEFSARQGFLNDWIMDRRRMVAGAPVALPLWRSRLAALISERLASRRIGRETTRWYNEMYGAENAAGWRATQGYLARMHAAMRARGGRLLVALLPLLVGLEAHYPFDAPTRAISSACAALGIPFHDALPALHGQPSAALWVHPVDLHPNERAHALLAMDLAPFVRRALAP